MNLSIDWIVTNSWLRPYRLKWAHSADYVPINWSGYTVMNMSIDWIVTNSWLRPHRLITQCWWCTYKLKWLRSDFVPINWIVTQSWWRTLYTEWLHSVDFVPINWMVTQCWWRPYTLKWLHSAMFLQTAVTRLYRQSWHYRIFTHTHTHTHTHTPANSNVPHLSTAPVFKQLAPTNTSSFPTSINTITAAYLFRPRSITYLAISYWPTLSFFLKDLSRTLCLPTPVTTLCLQRYGQVPWLQNKKVPQNKCVQHNIQVKESGMSLTSKSDAVAYFVLWPLLPQSGPLSRQVTEWAPHTVPASWHIHNNRPCQKSHTNPIRRVSRLLQTDIYRGNSNIKC
jgi:hypothetical protein